MAERTQLHRWVTRKIVQPAEGAMVYALFHLLGAMSVERASAIGGWLARTVGPRLGLTRRARHNLRRAFPEKSPEEIEKIVIEMWDNLGRVAAEHPHLGRLKAFTPDSPIAVAGIEHVDAALKHGRPIIFFTAHLANWEASGIAARAYGVPLNLIYRPANNPWVDRLFQAGRGEFARALIPKGAYGARLAITKLRAGEPLGMLIDQKMNNGIAVPFFGRDAMTAPALAELALRYDCTVLPVQVERLGEVNFRVTVHPPLELARSGDRHADVRAIMTRVNAALEGWIRERPGQWLWLHRRWSD